PSTRPTATAALVNPPAGLLDEPDRSLRSSASAVSSNSENRSSGSAVFSRALTSQGHSSGLGPPPSLDVIVPQPASDSTGALRHFEGEFSAPPHRAQRRPLGAPRHVRRSSPLHRLPSGRIVKGQADMDS